MKKRTTFLLLMLFVVMSSLSFADGMGHADDMETAIERAMVLDVINHKADDDNSFYDLLQDVTLQIRSGELEGEIIEVENVISGNYVFDIPVKPGEEVIVQIDTYLDDSYDVFITDYSRDLYLKVLVGLFVLTLIVVGRMKGLKTVVTIGLTIVMIWKVLLPAILSGRDPVPVTVMISVVVTVATILLVSGFRKKSFAAILGTIAGVLVAAFLAFLIGSNVKLTGMSSEEAIMLLNIPQGIDFDFRSLLFSGIMLGALGAVMDVAMSIASSIEEVHRANPSLGRMELFQSGMEVGKDVMGTMSNTLILAYTGSSIPLLLLFMAYDTPLIRLMNMDLIATEIVRSLAGSIGLILTIPLTAIMTVVFIHGQQESVESKGDTSYSTHIAEQSQ